MTRYSTFAINAHKINFNYFNAKQTKNEIL